MQYTEMQKKEVQTYLRKILKSDSTLYTILRSKSRGGMSRVLEVVFFDEVGANLHLSRMAAILLDLPWDSEQEGLRVKGVGFNAGLHVVSEVGRLVFGENRLKQVWL